MTDERRQLIPEPLEGYDPVVGAALWRLEDTRERTVEVLDAIGDAAVDWASPWGGNTVGTLLYHLAVIELDWLYAEILVAEPPEEFLRLFPYDVRDGTGRLTAVRGHSLDDHLARLAAVRSRFLYSLRDMTAEDFRRPRSLKPYDVTPEWVIHHLNQHEGEQRGQIGEVAVAGGVLQPE